MPSCQGEQFRDDQLREGMVLSFWVSDTSLAPAGDLSKGRFALIIHCLALKCCFSSRRIKINSSSSQEDLQQDTLSSKEEERQATSGVFSNHHKPAHYFGT